MFEKKIVGVLLVFVLLATGFSGNVSAKSGGGCGCLAVVDHGVFLNNTTDDNTLLVWVDGGDVFFTSSYNDYYNTTLQGVLGRVDVLRYETDDWGEYSFYTAVYVELNLSLKTIDSEPYRSFRYLSDAIVLLWSHGDRELSETLVDIARTEVFSNILYSENLTSPDDVAKSLFLYTKAEEKLGEDKVPAAVALYNAALYNLPTTPTLMWDKITRLSYNGNNTHPVVFSSGGVLHAGWIHREDGGVNYTFYALSTNFGRTWWTLDATTYGSPYLVAMGLDPYGGDPFVAMAATQLLESIYLIDGSHYFYVPINTPPVLPIPVDGEVGDTIYVSIDDPYLDRYQTYEYLRIGDRLFIKPICKPGGTPVPPPRAPDLVIVNMFVYEKNNKSFVFYFGIENKGDAEIINSLSDVWIYDNKSVNEKKTIEIDHLRSRENGSLIFITKTKNLNGFNVSVKLDPSDDLKEGDESNNQYVFPCSSSVFPNVYLGETRTKNGHGKVTAELKYNAENKFTGEKVYLAKMGDTLGIYLYYKEDRSFHGGYTIKVTISFIPQGVSFGVVDYSQDVYYDVSATDYEPDWYGYYVHSYLTDATPYEVDPHYVVAKIINYGDQRGTSASAERKVYIEPSLNN